jgi:hypothetical protein
MLSTETHALSSFRLRAKKFMLTYKSHVDKEGLHNYLRSIFKKDFEIKIAHETSNSGYEHTHAVVCLSFKPDIKNARSLDFDGNHPNLTVPSSTEHWHNMVSYLDKQDPEAHGEITLKATSVEKFENATAYVLQCQNLRDLFKCPTPETAMQIASRLPYFRTMWETCGKKKLETARHSTFSRPLLDLTTNWLLIGPPGTGKTQFALAHFKEPCLVSHIDDLKNITITTDGIVFDDMSFRHYAAGSIIHLLDREVSRTIHARYFNAQIPADLPKIFTNNRGDIFEPEKGASEDEIGAINRRYRVLRVTAKLF